MAGLFEGLGLGLAQIGAGVSRGELAGTANQERLAQAKAQQAYRNQLLAAHTADQAGSLGLRQQAMNNRLIMPYIHALADPEQQAYFDRNPSVHAHYLSIVQGHMPPEHGVGYDPTSGTLSVGGKTYGADTNPGTPPPDSGSRPASARRPGLLPMPATRIATDRRGGASRAGRGEQGTRSGYGFRLITFQHVPASPQAGREPHVTVNDLLIAALIVAIDRWNAAHGQPSSRIRITMPVNSRLRGEAGAAGNLSRLTAVTAQLPDHGYELRSVVADVAAQTRWAKHHPGPQVDPLIRALAAPWCPAAVKRRLLRLLLRTAGPLFCDTSLLSNLGVVTKPPRFGHVPASHLWFSTSAHMPRGLSVGAVTLGGRLNVCLRYRRALFSETAAARFTDELTAALSQITSLRSPQ